LAACGQPSSLWPTAGMPEMHPPEQPSGKHPRPPCDRAWAEQLGVGAGWTFGLRFGVLGCWVGLVWSVWSGVVVSVRSQVLCSLVQVSSLVLARV
jgi:hypothetical protein